jgi:hypothetical protein
LNRSEVPIPYDGWDVRMSCGPSTLLLPYLAGPGDNGMVESSACFGEMKTLAACSRVEVPKP